MLVKKFEAPTIKEALEAIKRELGPDAIILQTKKNKSGFGLMSKGSFEVTAAISEKNYKRKKYLEKKMPDDYKEKLKRASLGRQSEIYENYAKNNLEYKPQPKSSGTSLLDNIVTSTQDKVQLRNSKSKITSNSNEEEGYIDFSKNRPQIVVDGMAREASRRNLKQNIAASSNQAALEQELKNLKEMLIELKRENQESESSQSHVLDNYPPALQEAFEVLLMSGLNRINTIRLVRHVFQVLGPERSNNFNEVVEQLAFQLMENVEVFSLLDGIERGKGPHFIALVGPTGVGKTTTIAKIASEAKIKKNLKVALVNIDTYKISAADQLQSYAKILQVPFRNTATTEQLDVLIDDLQSCDLVLIDTAGRSQKDNDSILKMKEFLSFLPNLRTELVLSSTTRDVELYEMGKRFSIFKPEGMIFSKLDESHFFGAVYNTAQKLKLPLVYFTTGQNVPGDIEEASKERLAALVLDL